MYKTYAQKTNFGSKLKIKPLDKKIIWLNYWPKILRKA